MDGVPRGASPGDAMSATPLHLAKRFVLSLDRRPPSVHDEVFASRHLTGAEHALWTRLADTDRRHAIAVARRFLALRPDADRAEIAGALLHDIGKIEADLSTTRRVLVTVMCLVGRTPRSAAAQRYLDHEEIGASLLTAAGSDRLTIDTALGSGPAGEALRRADQI